MIDEDELYFIAARFRVAIEKALNAGEFSSDSIFQCFPRGCCGFTSDLLAKYLREFGVETQYMSGNYEYGWEGRSHAWLETYDGVVIDITRDQFKNDPEPLHCEQEVYVGIEDEICKLFEQQALCPEYQEDVKPAWMGETQTEKIFCKRYGVITKYL